MLSEDREIRSGDKWTEVRSPRRAVSDRPSRDGRARFFATDLQVCLP